jgi:hypothetical protein
MAGWRLRVEGCGGGHRAGCEVGNPTSQPRVAPSPPPFSPAPPPQPPPAAQHRRVDRVPPEVGAHVEEEAAPAVRPYAAATRQELVHLGGKGAGGGGRGAALASLLRTCNPRACCATWLCSAELSRAQSTITSASFGEQQHPGQVCPARPAPRPHDALSAQPQRAALKQLRPTFRQAGKSMVWRAGRWMGGQPLCSSRRPVAPPAWSCRALHRPRPPSARSRPCPSAGAGAQWGW